MPARPGFRVVECCRAALTRCRQGIKSGHTDRRPRETHSHKVQVCSKRCQRLSHANSVGIESETAKTDKRVPRDRVGLETDCSGRCEKYFDFIRLLTFDDVIKQGSHSERDVALRDRRVPVTWFSASHFVHIHFQACAAFPHKCATHI